ncbi:SDR family NAD(P)-dependent oxidoreductase [Acidovorax sp. HDW3]|uniref:SDR family NAD(P)-dependent oxidoreductase n=1 Tax=Acidovorax sp. HDW3 TaxID=2714923 RepID=UPI00140A844D|nr:SDR family NAD(P)-dependent oxidoreductase [Acidovorax sp. HDW3]QIL44712.1 SDR family NAD(P)-dependent oxidoreductase [Acidovorax sp. HDW3]
MKHDYPWKHGAPRTVFITGASSGIGRAMAQELTAAGASIALFNRSDARAVLLDLRAAAPNPEQRFACYRADVGKAQAIAAAVAQAVQELGAPDLAIHSAGVLHNGPLLQSSAADFEQVVDVNLKGTRHFAAAVLAHMQPGSQIAFIASLAALTGNFGYTAYCASKYGVRGLAEALRYEMKLQGIAVSLCCPGEILTPMVVAEKRTMHPVSAAMKAFAGSSTLDVSVPALLRGIARREFEITDTPKAALTAFLSRHTPQLARAVGDAIARRAQERLSKGTP